MISNKSTSAAYKQNSLYLSSSSSDESGINQNNHLNITAEDNDSSLMQYSLFDTMNNNGKPRQQHQVFNLSQSSK